MTTPVKVTWTDPTKNVDGSAIPAGEITGFMIGVRDTSVTGSAPGTYPFTATAPASATSELFSLLVPVLPTGKPLAVAAQTLSASNGNSAWSAEATFTIPALPNPPDAVSVA